MSLLDLLTGGKSNQANADEQAAINAYSNVQTPDASALDLPALEQYASAEQMTPAQMQAFLQQSNALNDEDTDQTGTAAQKTAISQLANVANAGANGTPQEQAQIAQALEQSNTNLQGQRGSIDQQAEARGVAPGLLQAALGQQDAGQDAQNANASALAAQAQAYQAALSAMTSGASAGNSLQSQQNTQANTVAAAQNAMQQFNAANQQSAAAANTANQQAANATNVANNNQVSQANTGLANQRTVANAAVPQTVYQDQLQKAQGIAGANQSAAANATGQGQQNAGLLSGILGAGATIGGAALGGPLGAVAGSTVAKAATSNDASAGAGAWNGGIMSPYPNYATGGMVEETAHMHCFHDGGMCMKKGGMVPGTAPMPGDAPQNDIVKAHLSPGEAVIPRSVVQSNPQDVMALLAQRQAGVQPGMMNKPPMQQPPQQGDPGHHPQDVAALLMAMKKMRGGR